MFFIIVFFIVPLAYYYLGKRLIEPAGLSARKKVLAWLAVSAFFLLVYFMRYLWRYNQSEPLVQILLSLAYMSLGFFGLLFSGIAVRDILLLAGRLIGWAWVRIYHSNPGPPMYQPLQDPDRRRFLVHTTNLGLLALSGGLAGYGINEASRPPRVKQVIVPLPHLPDDLENLTLAQITDLHVGPTIKRDFVEKVVARVMDLNSDLIVLTGDLVDGSVNSIKNDVAPLADLNAPLGKYFITGNHEYYHGVYDWVSEMERLGFEVLINAHRVVKKGESRLLVAGLPDSRAKMFDPGRGPDVRASLKGAPECQVKIMLAHRPQAVFETARHGFDLQLSGHTHGGQIFPGHLLIRLQEPFISGLHRLDRTWIYVSRGTGYWGPPMRVGAPGEITGIRLVKSV